MRASQLAIGCDVINSVPVLVRLLIPPRLKNIIVKEEKPARIRKTRGPTFGKINLGDQCEKLTFVYRPEKVTWYIRTAAKTGTSQRDFGILNPSSMNSHRGSCERCN